MDTSAQQKPVITRFPPSPTGVLHVGSYRTALYNYLYSKQCGGTFILRIEDTDRERSSDEYEHNINESLEWLGLRPDDSYRQSDRHDRHTEVLQQLLDSGSAYISREEPREAGQRSEVIRFRNPGGSVTFHDEVRGDVTFDTSDLGDFVIAKSMDEPLYHLAAVIDDIDSGVTHVIRGEDHISNTPRQIQLQEAMGAPRPIYAHLPLILAPDRSKLSKRNGARAILEYREEGFLPNALVNFMALLGWNPGTEQEIFTEAELLEEFSLERVHKGGAMFSEEKLRWINREHIKRLSDTDLKQHVKAYLGRAQRITEKDWARDDERIAQVSDVVLERIETFAEVTALAEAGEFDYFFEAPMYEDPDQLCWKKVTREETTKHLGTVRDKIESIKETRFSSESVKSAVWDYAEQEGRGDVLWPLRFALSGRDKSPDPFTLAGLLGKQETLKRIDAAVQALS